MSKLEVDAIEPQSGTTITVGASGDTITVPSGATLNVAGTLVQSGDTGITGAVTITTTDNTAGLTLKCTDADASVGPLLVFHRDSSSPANNDFIGNIQFEMENDAGEQLDAVSILGKISDVADGTEDAEIQFFTRTAGSMVDRFAITRTEVSVNDDSIDSNFRVESNGNANMLFVDGGNDAVGIGTASPSQQLHVNGHIVGNSLNIPSNTSSPPSGVTIHKPADNTMAFRTNSSERMRLTDTGLGISTSTPLLKLDVTATAANEDVIRISHPSSPANAGAVLGFNSDGTTDNNVVTLGIHYSSVFYDVLNLKRSTQFVGISTTNPQEQLDISSNAPRIRFSDTSVTDLHHKIGSEANDLEISCDAGNDQASSHIGFKVDGSEKMRIDSSGNVLVATTATDSGTVGGRFFATGLGAFTVDGSQCLTVNRLNSAGELIRLKQGGTTIGKINCRSSFGVYEFGSLGTGIGGTSSHAWLPMVSNARSDNTTSLGQASYRMTDIYATNGTIATSDQNEKQSIKSLTTAEMNVGKKLSSLIKTYKWNSSVEEKGDSARTHTGIIAQDVQQAFNDEGLDASKYGLWCSDTWSIDADGEEIENPEEVTENNPSKTKLGIRYEELLSFIQAYNDQRFTELEARITTLENA